MKFPFYKYPASNGIGKPWRLDPRIEVNLVGIKSGDGLDLLALIDSGASANLMSAQVAEAIGIPDLDSGEMRSFYGISNQRAVSYGHEVWLRIGGHRFKSKVFFSPDVGPETVLLGMEGFFDHFVVILDRAGETIELKPVR